MLKFSRYLTVLFCALFFANQSFASSKHYVETIKNGNMDTLLVGGIGPGGAKVHDFWTSATPNEFVINIDPDTNPHMLGNAFDGQQKVRQHFDKKSGQTVHLNLNFFTPQELGTLKKGQQIKHVRYEHVGHGFLEYGQNGLQTMASLADILPDGGTFEYSSFWVTMSGAGERTSILELTGGLKSGKGYAYTDRLKVSALEKKRAILAEALDLCRHFEHQRIGGKQYQAHNKTQELLKKYRNNDEMQELYDILKSSPERGDKELSSIEMWHSLPDQKKDRKLGALLRSFGGDSTISTAYARVKQAWKKEHDAQIGTKGKKVYIKGLDFLLRQELGRVWTHAVGSEASFEICPFEAHKNYFQENCFGKYFDIFMKQFGLDNIHFFIDCSTPTNGGTVYSFRINGVKGSAQALGSTSTSGTTSVKAPSVQTKPPQVPSTKTPKSADHGTPAPAPANKKEAEQKVLAAVTPVSSPAPKPKDPAPKSETTPSALKVSAPKEVKKESMRPFAYVGFKLNDADFPGATGASVKTHADGILNSYGTVRIGPEHEAHNAYARMFNAASVQKKDFIRHDVRTSVQTAVQEVKERFKGFSAVVQNVDIALRLQELELRLCRVNHAHTSKDNEGLDGK